MAPPVPSVPAGSWQVWVMAARPATLPASVAPVLVGTAVGLYEGAFSLVSFLAVLTAAVLIQIGTNLANDLFDFEQGADTAQRVGPPRVTQSGLASPRQVRSAMIASFALAGVIGLYLVAVGGWPILLIGLCSIAAGITYTGGPWPFGYHGLGDVAVFVFFGLVAVMGSAYVQTGSFSGVALAAALPVGCTVTAILVVNNLRDVETDRQAGKYTLAVRLGPALTRLQYILLLLLPYGLVAVFVMGNVLPRGCWLAWVTVPVALSLVRRVGCGAAGRALNPVLKRTAQLHLLFGLLLAGGFLL
ncbi:MAG: 1,4-dihydroxy-2-naphthoate polyprenyltransferase [Candidatus Binatia bacterium]|nr:1,4-dihydroxy-2-naphthoate polyprenyltransferase [Candidatus Binatia bacterium]